MSAKFTSKEHYLLETAELAAFIMRYYNVDKLSAQKAMFEMNTKFNLLAEKE